LVLVVVVLLVSADAVFASLFDVGDVGSVIQTLFWFVVGVFGVADLLRLASTDRGELSVARHHPLNALTVGTVLVSLVVVYGTFAITQAVTLTGGARRVLRTEGLSYAEYARTGFFQLLAVAAITWMVLAGLRALTDETTSSTITRGVSGSHRRRRGRHRCAPRAQRGQPRGHGRRAQHRSCGEDRAFRSLLSRPTL
jgi:hypothetical protein